MAETAQEKTQKPTSKRLSDARKKGHVPTSQEMTSAVMIITLTVLVYFLGSGITNWAMDELHQGFSLRHETVSNPQVLHRLLTEKTFQATVACLPFMAVIFFVGIITNLMISGKSYNPSALTQIKFDMIHPMAGFKQLFSKKTFVRLLLAAVKVAFIGAISYNYIKDKIFPMAEVQWAWDMGILATISQIILGALIRICIGLLIIGLADLIYQKWKYIEDLKMTKQEVKEEHKNYEGSPEVRRKIRQKQFETALRRMMKAVPDANVVLVNPTHYAVALKYDPETMAAPVVVAKGKDHVCEKIKEIARTYGVPIVRRPVLARNLYASVELDKPIPEKLYVAVAEVLALVHRLRHTGVGA